MRLHARMGGVNAGGLHAGEEPLLWMNGKVIDEDAAGRTTLLYAVQSELQWLQERIYYGHLSDREKFPEAILAAHKALPRYNALIFSSEEAGEGPRQLALVGPVLRGAARGLQYVHQPGTEDEVKAVSHWVVADPDSQVLPPAHPDILLVTMTQVWCLGWAGSV